MGDKMYCGIGDVPKGKVRASPEYCIQNNQVRYYGLVAIDPELLKKKQSSTANLVKEQTKLRKIDDEANYLLKQIRNLKVIVEDDRHKPSTIKNAQKKLDKLIPKKAIFAKKLRAQLEYVKQLEKEEAERRKIEREMEEKEKKEREKKEKEREKEKKLKEKEKEKKEKEKEKEKKKKEKEKEKKGKGNKSSKKGSKTSKK